MSKCLVGTIENVYYDLVNFFDAAISCIMLNDVSISKIE